jgi:hypothetical protein
MKIGDIVKFNKKYGVENPESGCLVVASDPWQVGDMQLVRLAYCNGFYDICTGELFCRVFIKLRGGYRTDGLEVVDAVVESEVEKV